MADEIRRLIRVRTDKAAHFKRDGFGKKQQLSGSWRKPRGQHNKQREQKKAKGNLPKPGFGSPITVRGMHPSGFFEILVHTADDLEGLDPKTQAIRIASSVGSRKRSVLQEKALTAGLRVLNVKVVTAAKKPEAPAEEKEVAPAEKKGKSPAKTVKAAAEKKKEVPLPEKEPGKKVKEPVAKDEAGPEESRPAEVRETKKPMEKAPKKKAESGEAAASKKAAKPKPAPATVAKEPKKTAAKTAARPRKSTGKEVKGNE